MKIIKQGVESLEISRTPEFEKSKAFMDAFMKGNIDVEEQEEENEEDSNNSEEIITKPVETTMAERRISLPPIQSSIADILGLEHTNETVSFILLENNSFTIDVTAIGYTCNQDSIAILLPQGIKFNCPKLVQFTIKLAGKPYNVVYPGNSLNMSVGQLLQLLIVN